MQLNGRTIVLFGANGNLGQALAPAAAQAGAIIQTMGWATGTSAVDADCRDILGRLAAIKGDIDIVFAGGVTDPAASQAILMSANVERPLAVIDATLDDQRYRYLTIGSAVESFSGLTASNRYLASKALLCRRIETLARDPRRRGKLVHLRGHTFYGGRPAPHSFLGQLYASLPTPQPFPLSAGHQFPGYVHVEDVARPIVALLAPELAPVPTHHPPTGEPAKP